MQSGWVILNYHNVDWEESLLVRGLGGTVRPDVFAEHLRQLDSDGELISVDEGLARLSAGDSFRRPAFSIWFDDGFTGTRVFGLPICHRFGIRPAWSVNSRFALRQEMFWRAKLSYLSQTDGLRHLRAALRQDLDNVPTRLANWSRHNFGPKLLGRLDEVYERLTTPEFRADAFRIFDTVQGLREAHAAGCIITNHTAAHYQFHGTDAWPEVHAQFEECESLVGSIQSEHRFWVVPFGYGAESFVPLIREHATPVVTGGQVNTPGTWRDGVLYRVPVFQVGRKAQCATLPSRASPRRDRPHSSTANAGRANTACPRRRASAVHTRS